MRSLPLPPGPAGHLLFGSLPTLTADWLGTMRESAQRFGPIVRFRTPWPLKPIVLLTDPAHIEQVLKDPTRFRKGQAQRFGAPILGDGLLLSEGTTWRRQRGMAAPAFQRSKIAASSQDMAACAEEMVARWTDGGERDVLDDATYATIRAVARTLFGTDAGDEPERAARGLAQALDGFDAYFHSWFPIPVPLPTRSGLRIYRAARVFDGVVSRFIAARRRQGGEGRDLLSTLLRAQDEADGSTFSDRELRDMVVTLFGAGFETTATSLGWTFYLLARHPEIADRVRAEVAGVVGDGRVGIEHLARLPFLGKVLKESMRLFPAAWLIPREPLEDYELGGYRIEAGSQVFLCSYLVHRDPALYTAPDRFDPDRWTPELTERLPRLAYFPFGGGQRICIGNSFAMVNLSIVVATVATRVRFEPTAQCPEPPRVTFALRPRGGVRLRIRRLDEQRRQVVTPAAPAASRCPMSS